MVRIFLFLIFIYRNESFIITILITYFYSAIGLIVSFDLLKKQHSDSAQAHGMRVKYFPGEI